MPSRSTAVVLALSMHAAPAQAQLARTFLSANGSDSNNCARAAPCRTLQEAHNKTSAGGEINMLDPAGYGRVVIQKSISIVNDGVGSAGILVPASSTGVRIIAGAKDKINLRGLIIEGAGIGEYGIVFETGRSLTIENSVIRNMTISGIAFIPTDFSYLSVSNTLVADNRSHGIVVEPFGAGAARATFTRVEVHHNSDGGIGISGETSTGSIQVTVADSVVASNSVAIYVRTQTGQASGNLMLVRSVLANNIGGLSAIGPAATIKISQSILVGSEFVAWIADAGGAVLSAGDNTIEGPAPPTYEKN
jgi:hypothetical protein